MIAQGKLASDIVASVHAGERTVRDIAASYLDRIERYDGDIQAFVTVDRALVEAEAARLDTLAANGARLPLHGVPVGVKDLIDVAGLPTIAGFEPYRNISARKDAAIVAALRSLGALMIGKTHTPQFAAGNPPPTRNPWNLTKSPAASSSGSGAAVAAGMAPITLGTQTTGSVLRPAAFNGVVGIKPTYGWYSVDGVVPDCWSLDTLGVYGQTVDDVSMVYDALVPGEEPAPVVKSAPRFALLTEFLELSSPDVVEHTTAVVETLRQAGAEIVETTMPESFEFLTGVHFVLWGGDFAALHAPHIAANREHYDSRIQETVQIRSLIPVSYLNQARRHRRALIATFERFMAPFDALLLPTVSTEPCDFGNIGDTSFQMPATLLGTPSISLPTGLSPNQLPLGTQLIGHRGADRRLLAVSSWIASHVPLIDQPDLDRTLTSLTR